MWYEFKCPEHGKFKVKQSIFDEHIANCPKCNKPAQRIFRSMRWYYDHPKNLYDKKGNYREDPFHTY